MKFTGTWHPNELQWLDYMIGCQPLVLVMVTMVICSINSLPYADIDHRHGSTLLQVMATSPVLQTHNECNAIVGHVPSWLSGPHLSWLSGPHLSWLSGPHLSWLSGPHSGQLPLYLLSSQHAQHHIPLSAPLMWHHWWLLGVRLVKFYNFVGHN